MSNRRAWSAMVFGVILVTACEDTPEPDVQPEADPGSQRAEAESPPTEAPERPERGDEPRDEGLTPRPIETDPEGGEFTLDEALEGLEGEGEGESEGDDDLVAEIRTGLGTLTCVLYDDRAPATVANFVGLARGKRPWWDAREEAWVTERYYDGTTFHRVIPGFMIQGGDYMGTGTGEVGYTIRDEVHPSLKHDRAGQLCMANRGPHTNAAQFFLTDGPAPHLDRSYTIFGECEPTELISEIAAVPQSGPPDNRPEDPIEIERVRIRRE